jgi:hypothetical protein
MKSNLIVLTNPWKVASEFYCTVYWHEVIEKKPPCSCDDDWELNVGLLAYSYLSTKNCSINKNLRFFSHIENTVLGKSLSPTAVSYFSQYITTIYIGVHIINWSICCDLLSTTLSSETIQAQNDKKILSKRYVTQREKSHKEYNEALSI